MYCTYILQSTTSGRLYIGQTNNLTDRFHRHNTNQNKATKGKGPWELKGEVSFDTRSEAVQLERRLKSWKNPQKVLIWLATLDESS